MEWLKMVFTVLRSSDALLTCLRKSSCRGRSDGRKTKDLDTARLDRQTDKKGIKEPDMSMKLFLYICTETRTDARDL